MIGATDTTGSVGRAVLWNLLSTPFGGTVYPVNPSRPSVLGVKGYERIAELPERPELAIITTPASAVPELITECVQAGVGGAIVISDGFREHGAEGAALELEITRRLQGSQMRIIGPNSFGVMNPPNGLNACFAQTIARPGNVAFISQSGALCTAVLDWSLSEMVGFSAFVSVGSMLDVGWGDLIDYFGDDPQTQSIVVYMESIGDARAFLSAAREVSLNKPIIVIKAGRTEVAAKAAASHTGLLAGSDEVLDAAFRRVGVLRVSSIGDLFYMAEVLAKQPRPRGPRLMVLTNSGGPGVLATDVLIATGGELGELSPESMEALNKLLPPYWSHSNPIDILADATPERFSQAMEIVIKDPSCDGVLVLAAPQGLSAGTATAEVLRPFAKGSGKPVLASFMGGVQVAAANSLLTRMGIPAFSFPDTAARAFNYMWKYSYNLRGIYETPVAGPEAVENPDRAYAERMVGNVRVAGRTLLTEYESKQLLAAYGIPIVETRQAHTEDEAVAAAEAIGYPVVLKLLSETVAHKTEVGGVQLSIRNQSGVRSSYQLIARNVREKLGEAHFLGVTVQPMAGQDGYELIVGSSIDPQFGPVLLFGSGGRMVEIYEDRALALPPLNTTLARRMMESTKIWTVLRGLGGRRGVDTGALEQLLVRFSQLVVEQPWVQEIDINPLLAGSDRLLALDARVVVHGLDMNEDRLPRSAIRPYPVQYVGEWTLKNGIPLTIRPIRPEDEPLMIKFHERLSDRSVYLRYFQPLKLTQRVAHERLTRICFLDYDREMALVAVRKHPDGAQEIIAVGRLSRLHGINEAECAVLISDEYQGQGLGTELFRRSLQIARQEKIARVSSTLLAENREMRSIVKRLGFTLRLDMEDQTVRAAIDLAGC